MTTALILTISFLILAILFLIFRIGVLSNVMKGRYNQIVGKSNSINAILFIVVLISGLIAFYVSFQDARQYFLPQAASEHGVKTDGLFWLIMAFLTLAFLLTNSLLYIFPYVYRYKKERTALFYPDNHLIERLWTIIPALVMAAFVAYGWFVWSDIMKPRENTEVIEVMGKQFAWQVRYPGADNKLGKYHFKKIDAINEFGIDFEDEASFDDFIPSELVLPVGKEVTLQIRARDVIHSVFLPHFRVKMDAVPGMPTKFTFKPTITTEEMREITKNPKFNYEMACTEICGRGHYAMRFPVRVLSLEEYNKWKTEQKSWASQNNDYVQSKTKNTAFKSKYLKPIADSTAAVSVDSTTTIVSDSLTVSKDSVVTKK
jgi:cytochrome c oxidase subunit 2